MRLAGGERTPLATSLVVPVPPDHHRLVNALEPNGAELLVGVLALGALVVVLIAIVEAVQHRDVVSALLLILLGPIGLVVYLARRSSRSAAGASG